MQPQTYAVKVIPHVDTQRTTAIISQFLAGIALQESVSLEILSGSTIALLLRVPHPSYLPLLSERLRRFFPGAEILPIDIVHDPVYQKRGMQVSIPMRGPYYGALHRWDVTTSMAQQTIGNDPLLGILHGIQQHTEQERVLTSLVIRRAPDSWASGLVQMADRHSLQQQRQQERSMGHDETRLPIPLLAFLGLLLLVELLIARRFAFSGRAAGAVIGAWFKHGVVPWGVLAPYLIGVVVSALLWGVGYWLWTSVVQSQQLTVDVEDVVARTCDPAFMASLVVTVMGTESPHRAKRMCRDVLNAYRALNNQHGVRFEMGWWNWSQARIRTLRSPFAVAGRGGRVLSMSEIVTMWHLPAREDMMSIPTIEYTVTSRSMVAPVQVRVEGKSAWYIGLSRSGDFQVKVGIPADVIRRHMLVLAKTGKGKSTLLGHLVERGLQESETGIVVVDPHGDMAEAVLSSIPASRINTVTLVDLGDETVIPFNLLDATGVEDLGVHVERILRIFAGYYDTSWGPRMEDAFGNALRTLMHINRRLVEGEKRDWQLTLLDVHPLFLNASYRQELLRYVSDATLLTWWKSYYEPQWERDRMEIIKPVLTKIDRFTASNLARLMVGMPTMDIPIGEALREGHVLLLKGGGSRIGTETSALLLTVLLGLVQQAMISQGSGSALTRRQVLCVIDEFQTLPALNYVALLAEMRKYGMTFVLASQSLSYLSKIDPTLRSTVLANIDTIFGYAMSAEDALTMSPEFDDLSVQDLINQPQYHCYVKTNVQGQRLPVFSIDIREGGETRPEVVRQIQQMAATYRVSPAAAEIQVQRLLQRHLTVEVRVPKGNDMAVFAPAPSRKTDGEEEVYPAMPPPPPQADTPSRKGHRPHTTFAHPVEPSQPAEPPTNGPAPLPAHGLPDPEPEEQSGSSINKAAWREDPPPEQDLPLLPDLSHFWNPEE